MQVVHLGLSSCFFPVVPIMYRTVTQKPRYALTRVYRYTPQKTHHKNLHLLHFAHSSLLIERNNSQHHIVNCVLICTLVCVVITGTAAALTLPSDIASFLRGGRGGGFSCSSPRWWRLPQDTDWNSETMKRHSWG